MERFKRILRLSGYFLLIILASIGLGLAGGVAIPPTIRKDDRNETPIELLENKEEDDSDIDDHLLK